MSTPIKYLKYGSLVKERHISEIRTLKDLGDVCTYLKYKETSIPEGHPYPSAFIHPQKFSDNSANELTKSILAYFELIGWKAWRQASEGRFIQGKEYTDVLGHKKQEKGFYIPRSKGGKGAPDLMAIQKGTGKLFGCEIKHGKDRMHDDQNKFKKEMEESGGVFIIARSWDGFFFDISKYIGGK